MFAAMAFRTLMRLALLFGIAAVARAWLRRARPPAGPPLAASLAPPALVPAAHDDALSASPGRGFPLPTTEEFDAPTMSAPADMELSPPPPVRDEYATIERAAPEASRLAPDEAVDEVAEPTEPAREEPADRDQVDIVSVVDDLLDRPG